MDDVKHLDVRLNRLPHWYTNGLLCIGDAAHAMSPAGGVGINLAVQDAVATATLLAQPLLAGKVTTADLAKVQRRRWLPTVVVQRVQRLLHGAMFEPVLNGTPCDAAGTGHGTAPRTGAAPHPVLPHRCGHPPGTCTPVRPARTGPGQRLTTGLASVPIPSIVTATVCPSRIGPTPAGVPVRMTSPGSSVITAVIHSTSLPMGWISRDCGSPV